MAKVINELAVCTACLQAIVNDDYTGLDYYYGPDEAQETKDRIIAGLEAWGTHGHLVAADKDYGFCQTSCDVCGDELAGERFGVSVLD